MCSRLKPLTRRLLLVFRGGTFLFDFLLVFKANYSHDGCTDGIRDSSVYSTRTNKASTQTSLSEQSSRDKAAPHLTLHLDRSRYRHPNAKLPPPRAGNAPRQDYGSLPGLGHWGAPDHTTSPETQRVTGDAQAPPPLTPCRTTAVPV